ncbi:hypothetical protein JXA63_03695 [Candidatus Woesebacteria bacterium]|nr:hypothetical protein [Candidatus Woesebacteria bacterium]
MSDTSKTEEDFTVYRKFKKASGTVKNRKTENSDAEKTRGLKRKKRLEKNIREFTSSVPKRTNNPLSSFLYYPDKVKFANKDPEEEIILLLRRHPLTNVKPIIIAFVMIISPAFLSVMPFFEYLPMNYQIILTIIWYMITTAFVFEEFLSWFFNVNIVTDERIIEVDFHNLIYRELTDANIDKIEDVTVKIGGAVRTYFNFGDVEIQTSAEVPHILFEAIPNPDIVARILRDLRVEEEQEKIEGRVR